ncbi:MAG: EAL domain-containing protein [Pseudomonadaceae bacterium]|nr:EAL domain-containing protein [Pseudomonadaceae bacterium]
MTPPKSSLLWFSRYLWLTVAIFVLFIVTFGFYGRAELRVKNANELRLSSLRLTDELRDSSDALTISARTFVVTGTPLYREQFENILAIRDGQRPRAREPQEQHWGAPAQDHGLDAALPLLELMRRAGFSSAEMQLLAQAKQASDALSVIEVKAMNLRAAGPAGRDAALELLFGQAYQQAKTNIMQPIFSVQRTVERRTWAAVQQAEQQARYLRLAVVLMAGLILLALLAARRSLQNILGGSLTAVYQRIERLGRGDFSAVTAMPQAPEQSVMGWLAQAQLQLASIDGENQQTKQLAVAAEQRFRDIVNTTDGIVWEADANTFQFTFISLKAERLLGFGTQEWLRPGFWVEHVHPDDQGWAPEYCAACTGRLEPHDFEYRFIAKDGRTVWLRDIVTVVAQDGAPRWLRGLMVDVTAQKLAEQELRIAAVAFESQEGMLVTNHSLEILRVNSAFTRITGYTAAEVLGRSPQLLRSGRHPPEFYLQLWSELNRSGVWQGEVWNRRKNGEIYPEYLSISAVRSGSGEVSHYVGTFSDITQRKLAMDEIHQLAFYDALTALPNRRLLLDRLGQALASSQRSGNRGALLFIDLDNFKQLNDSWGHALGDLLLQQVARRLQACVRGNDSVARLGGDEFVVMLEGLSVDVVDASEQTKYIGEKLIGDLSQLFNLDGREYQSTASIGVAMFGGAHTSVDELLRAADIAMYAAKKAGRNALCFFDPAMQEVINQRAAMQGELQKAVAEQQFVLHYQMQCEQSGHVVGAEVLIRWLHPERGLIPPNDFIALVEESGLILPIGHWVLSTACAQLARWALQVETAGLSLAVNVSAKQFALPTFVEEVKAQLEHTGIDPARLKLELTESLLLDNCEESIAKMLELKALGVGFSMDDFGTGYSSLSYLKRLPLDQLKIDRSFVRDVFADANDAVIAKTIIVLGQSLGLQVIAEGVETCEQLAFLVAAGCPLFQGYLFSKPLPLADFEAFLQRGCRAPLASNSSVCL